MRTADLDYKLPKELIAGEPAYPRDSARLMVLNRKNNYIEHSLFTELPNYLKEGDVIVFNKSKVFPARIFGENSKRKKVEVVFLEEISNKKWEIIIGGKVNNNEIIIFPNNLRGIVRKNKKNIIEINKNKKELFNYLDKNGKMPLPPYIKREANEKDKTDYQNIFANMVGSAAAPTAGLHFTNKLMSNLKKKGVQLEYVILHVGLGTFAPVKVEKVEDYDIHSEYFEIDKKTASRLNAAKKEGRRIIACGTTSVRVLESCSKNGYIEPRKEHTKLFIYPGYNFEYIDGIITNFHTPKSSLLALVYAFYGGEKTKKAYKEAIEKRYRFFSYGDGMLII